MSFPKPEQGERDADSVRAEPVLDHRADTSLGIDGVRNHREDDHEDQSEGLDQRNQDQYEKVSHTVAGASSASSTSWTPLSLILLSESEFMSGIESVICLNTSSIR